MIEQDLKHYGVKGMKWGVRRYQNADGSLTSAGQKRLAKSIQKSAKDTSSEARRQLRKDIHDDLATNYKSQMRHHIKDVKAKKKAWLKLDTPENDYWESGASLKDSAAAYNQTLDWFKKNDKQYLNEIKKKNGGKETGLDSFHDFRKTYEGFEDKAWAKGEKKFYKEKNINRDTIDKAYDDYRKSCESAAKTILGRYSDTKISKVNSWDTDNRVYKVVADTLAYERLEDFD